MTLIILYKIPFNKDPKPNIKIEGNFKYEKLLNCCLEDNKIKRWSIEEILNFIEENDFEEKEEEEKEIKENEIKDEESKDKQSIKINDKEGNKIITLQNDEQKIDDINKNIIQNKENNISIEQSGYNPPPNFNEEANKKNREIDKENENNIEKDKKDGNSKKTEDLKDNSKNENDLNNKDKSNENGNNE